MGHYFTPDFLKFFKELASNNNKDWFDLNRERYHKSVKEPFEKFINDFILLVQKVDKEIKIGPKDAIFRINRDIRFSKDKTPYKINSSALITPGGRKDMATPGFYMELGPEKLAIYSGAYFLESLPLLNVRKAIAKNDKAFATLINDKKFKSTFGELQGEESARIPKELKVAAEKQPLILRKQFYFGTELKASTITNKDLMKIMVDHFKIAMPLNAFLRKAIK